MTHGEAVKKLRDQGLVRESKELERWRSKVKDKKGWDGHVKTQRYGKKLFG